MFCAENVTGIKQYTETAGAIYSAVAERSVSLWRIFVRIFGDIGSENADMSNDKEGEKPSRRKSKGSCLKLIWAGLAGP